MTYDSYNGFLIKDINLLNRDINNCILIDDNIDFCNIKNTIAYNI